CMKLNGGLPIIVLVTGATAGFSRTIAPRFAADGARIIAAGRREVAALPPRVNIDTLQMMPVTQSFGPLRIHKE
ncbi:MAG: hypothetical protein JWR10_68, partial [Rubritepida sp.]|nr:hypothetical protein [Rubritepida sp.]